MGTAGKVSVLSAACLLSWLLVIPDHQLAPKAQTPHRPLPPAVNRYAWFGCDRMTVNGNCQISGVQSVGGQVGADGNVGSNGPITVTGTNAIRGNATPGPGEVVHITGSRSQISGSVDPAAAVLPCEAQSVSDWAAYALANNNNAAIPSAFLKANGTFSLSGNKTCTLPAGLYYLTAFTVNGNAKLLVGGPVAIVSTGPMTVNGSCQLNKGGDPSNLILVSSSDSPVTLNDTAKVSLKLYAPLSVVTVGGNLTGYGCLWGKTLTGNGSVTWNRLDDTTSPTLAIWQPATGTVMPQAQPPLEIAYDDGTGGTGVDPSTLQATLDGTDVKDALTLSAAEATGQAPSSLAEGDHALQAQVADFDGNVATATSTFTVDTLPPVLDITGVTEGGLYGQPVTPQIIVSDPHLDPATVVVTLNGQPFASGAPVTQDGDYVLTVSAADTLGHTAQASVHFSIDTQPPSISITGVAEAGIYGQAVTPEIAVNDPNLNASSVVITLDGQPYVSGTPVSQSASHVLAVSTADTLGHSAQVSVHFDVDMFPPTITITGVTEGSLYGQAVTPVIAVTDPHLNASSTVITMDGQPFTSGTPVSQDGTHTLAVSASDTLGHNAQAAVHFTLDVSAPVIAISGVSDGGLYGQAVTPVVTVTDPHLDPATVTTTLNGQPFTSGTSVAQDGDYTLGVSAADSLGHQAQATMAFSVDTQPPTISITGVADGEIYGASVMPHVAVTDPSLDPATVSIQLDNQPYVSGTAVTAEGAHTLSVSASDKLSHAAQTSVNFSIDTLSPVIVVAGVSDGGIYGTGVTPVVTVTDPHLNASSVVMTLNGQPYVSGTPVDQEGPYTLAVSAADTLGHTVQQSFAFRLDFFPPAITVTGVEEGGVYGGAVTPVVTVSNPDLNASSVSIQLDGVPFVSATAVAAEGPHTLTVSAADMLGHTAQTALTFVIDLSPPVIAVTGVADGGVYGSAVTPAVSVTDPHMDASTVVITLDGQPFASGTPVSLEGDHVLAVSASDTLGHTSQKSIAFAIDLNAPSVAISGVADGAVYAASVSPVVTVNDPHLVVSSVTITLDGQPFTSGAAVTGEGNHALTAAASDVVGHTAHQSLSFSLDLSPPSIQITGVDDGAWYNHGVAPQVAITDPHLDPASVQIALNGQPYVSGTAITQEGYFVLAVSGSDTVGHTAQASRSFAIDTTPPAISVSAPPDGGITKDNPVTLSGYVMDAHPEALTVNGQAAGSPGQSSFSVPVTLTEGPNTIGLQATDRAGNSASLTWHVTLKTSPPTVAISVPMPGSVTRDSAVNVAGTVSQDAVQVTANGQGAAIVGGAFTVNQVPLQEGTNTLTATATDAAGNAASATVQVSRDSQPPILQVTSPSDGAHTGAQSITVTGTIADASPFTATLNGAPLAVTGGAFSQDVALTAGTNWITLSAVDSAGNAVERSLSVVREAGSFTVTSLVPSNGAGGVSPTASITVQFNRDLKESTLTVASLQVSAGGQSLPGALVYHGSTVVYLPSAAYGNGTPVSVSLTPALTDLSGTPLSAFTAAFTTLSASGSTAPLTLTLAPVPALTNQPSLAVSGATSPGAAVTIQGAASPVTATAGADGVVTATLPLAPDALNTFTATASLGGSTTAPQSFSIVQDSTPPFVTNFQTDGDDLLCDFNEAIDPQSLTVDSVRLNLNGVGILVTPGMESAGTRLRITPDQAIGSGAAALTFTTGIRDLAGNALASPFVRTFNGGSTGQAFLEGEIFDDVTGLPLPGGSVTLVQGGTGQTAAGGWGAWSLAVPSRQVAVRLSSGGHTDAYRQATLSTGAIGMALDARLTPLSGEQKTLGAAGGPAVFAGGLYTLAAPGGALPDGTQVRVTALSAQGLPFPLPPGFSPLAAYRVDVSAPPSASLTLVVPAPAGAAGTVPAALFDPTQLAWIGTQPATIAATATLAVDQPGTYVLFRPDSAPLSPPPDAVPGEVLTGIAPGVLDASSAQLGTVPSLISPSQKAQATLVLTPATSVPSGLPFQVTFTESLDVREGTAVSTQHYSPYTEDLFAYQDPANPGQMKALFPVSPFPGIDVVTLLEGRIDLAAGPYDATPVGGGIFDPRSGQAMAVDGEGGTRATLPPQASSSALPVRIFPVLRSSLLAPIPQGFTFLGGVELNLGGGTLTAPATLSLDPATLAAALQSGDTVVVVRATTVAGVATYLATDLGGINTATNRLETAGAGSPWPQVTGEGRYIFLKANSPIGFVSGRVLTPQAQGVPGAAVGLVGATWNGATHVGTQTQKRVGTPSGAAVGLLGEIQGNSAQRSQSAQRSDLPESKVSHSSSAASTSLRLRSRIQALVREHKAPEAALVLVDLSGITALSAQDGGYVIPAPLSSVTVKAVDLLTADTGEAQAAPTQTSPMAQKDVVINPSPIAVVSTSPADGATGVPVGSTLMVTFSKLVAPASVTASAFQVQAGSAAVSGSANVILGGQTVVFTPDSAWPLGAQVSVTLSGITDRLGQAAPSVHWSFTAVNPPPVRLDPGAIEARLPDANGNICIEGGPGAADGLATVYVINASHPQTTVSVTANPNGSFTACLPGAVGDVLEVHVLGQGGAEQVVTISRLVSADHTSASMGPEGGTFTAPLPDGTSVTLQVPPGAFDGPATLSVHPADAAQAAPVPAGFAAGMPVSVQLSQPAQKEIALVLHAPGDWALNDPTKQYWLVQTVTWGPGNTQSPMVLDTLRPTPCPGDTTGQCLITQSPPFRGLRESAIMQVYQTIIEWGFFVGEMSLNAAAGSPMIITTDANPFVSLTDLSGQYVLPAPKGQNTFTLSAYNAYSGQLLFKNTDTTVNVTPGGITNLGVITDDHTPPFPQNASPFSVLPFQVAKLSDSVTNLVAYTVTDRNGDGVVSAGTA